MAESFENNTVTDRPPENTDPKQETENSADDLSELDDGLEVLQDDPLFDLMLPADGELTPEQVMKHALSLAEMAGRMQLYYYQDKYYRKALREIKPVLGTIENAQEEYDRIRRLMQNARVHHLVKIYRDTCDLRDRAKTPEEFLYCAEQFEEVDSYQRAHHLNEAYTDPDIFAQTALFSDTLDQAAACRSRREQLLSGKQRKKIIAAAAAVVLLAGLYVFSHTPKYMLVKGTLESAAGMHGKAWQAYAEYYKATGDEAALEKELSERYLFAVKERNKGNAAAVYADFTALAAQDYRDSRELQAESEREELAAAAAGDTVKFAGAEWTVADTDESRRMLIRKEAIPEVPFSADGSECTWETSSVRQYLNGEYADQAFTPQEQALLCDTQLPAENSRVSGISGGNATTDRIFILSASEADRYLELLGETKRCWWLRTPGANPGTMSFVNTDKAVMEYGYTVASGKIRIKPVIWVETEEDGSREAALKKIIITEEKEI